MDSKETEEMITKVQMALLQKPIERSDERSQEIWTTLLRYRTRIETYFQKLRLAVVIDEVEQFAFLKQIPNEGNEDYPRLVPNREIDYTTSMILLQLRQILHEHDNNGTEGICVVTREQFYERMSLYLKDVANQALLIRRLNGKINLIHDKFGVIRIFGENDRKIEIKRSIKALIQSAFAEEMQEKQQTYYQYASEHFKERISEPELHERPEELLEADDE